MKNQNATSLHSLKGMLVYEIEEKEKKLSQKNLEYRNRISSLEGRIKKLEGTAEEQNKSLWHENNTLRSHIESNSSQAIIISEQYEKEIKKMEQKLRNYERLGNENK